MLKIEAAALNSFQQDLSKDPSRRQELSSSSSSSLVRNIPEPKPSTSVPNRGRFGEDFSGEESLVLVRGREKALQTVADKLEKKQKWLERKTAEGDVFYFNKETFESTREKPKDGYVPLLEQDGTEYDSLIPTSEEVPSWQSAIPAPFGRWEEVKTKEEVDKDLVDLQLPAEEDDEEEEQEVVAVPQQNIKKEITFTEKTLEKPMSSKTNVEFKKRKVNDNAKRNVRQRRDD